jgi:anti-sigma regulatory factor (Ser/Thr protein kinase)
MVVDDRGYALALSQPAYVGSTLRHQPFLRELIGQDELSLRQEYKNEQGKPVMAAGQRIPESNLYLAIEAPLPSTALWILKSWLFLFFSGAIGVGLTWYLLRRYFNESFAQNFELAKQVEALKAQLREQVSVVKPQAVTEGTKNIPTYTTDEKQSKTSPQITGVGVKPTSSVTEGTNLQPVEPPPIPKKQRKPVQLQEDEAGEFFFSIPSKIPAGLDFLEEKPEPPPADFVDPRFKPLGKIIQTSLERIKKRYGTPDVTVETHGLENLYSPGEESQLKTAFEEILKNAFEAVADTSRKNITIFAEKFEDYVRVSISDSGAGVSPENLEKIFEPFFSTKASSGVARGLGLNVVRRVAEEFNGRVQVFSEGRGTRVELEIPMDLAKGLPHLPQEPVEPEFGMLNLDFDEIERRQSKPLPPVNIRKPKVRNLE